MIFEYLLNITWRDDSKTSIFEVLQTGEAPQPPIVSNFRPIVYFM